MAEAPEALIQQAQSSLAVGDTASAQASLNHLLQHYPRHPQGLLRRGFVRIRSGDLAGALEDWEQAIEVDPSLQRQSDSPDFRPVVEAALQQIKQLISQDPANTRLQISLGRAYSAFGRYAQALGAFTSVLRSAPEEIEAGLGSAQVYLRLGQHEQALNVLQKLYELQPDSAELCWQLGRMYVGMNSVVQATRFFERATTLDPEDWKSNLELGQIFVRQGRHEQATARFQKSLQIKPDCAPALVGLAECCKELYRFEAAISYYQQAVALDPRDYKALCQMGSLCIQLGGLDLGIETLLQALDINQQDVEIFSSLAKAYQQKGDLPTAARYFAKTVELNPKDYFAAYNLGLIYRSQGQIQEAAQAFGSAAQLRPNDSQYQYQSARALLELDRVEEALEASRKAVALNPHSKESQLLFGRCCLEAERYEQAADAFRHAVQIDAQNVEAHYQLAVALLQLEQLEEARNSFMTVLRLSPQHAPSQLGLGHVARRTQQLQSAADHYRQAIGIDLTLKSAIQELIRLYLERHQPESINDFLRQLCSSRKGDHRIPAEFLRVWLETLEENDQIALAEDALDFVLNLFPTSPQAKENGRQLHLRAAARFLEQQRFAELGHHLEALRRINPADAQLLELEKQTEQAMSPVPSEPAAEPFAPLQDSLWPSVETDALRSFSSLEPPPPLNSLEPAPVRPAGQRGLLPPPPLDDLEAPAVGLAPPPLLDDEWLQAGVSALEPPPPLLSAPPPASAGINLEPPPVLPEAVGAVLPEPPAAPETLLSRLDIEDVVAAPNPLESLADLGQHYVDFALHLESCGWLKQASLCLADARGYLPDDPSLLEHQHRIVGAWADELERAGDLESARRLRPVSSPPLVAVLEAPPVPVAPVAPEPEPLAPPEPTVSWLEPPAPAALSQPEPPPQPELRPEPEAAPAPLAASAEAEPEIELSVPEEPAAEDSSSQIAEWMMSFQELPPQPAPEPVPEPAAEESVEPYRSAEFEVHLRGDESPEELSQLLARNPDEALVRLALLRALGDDVPALLKVFRELSQEDPDEPYHVLNLARAYAHTGSDSLAVLQYRKYVKMEPSSEGYRELGEVYERMGKSELAGQAQRRAQQLAEQEAADD